MEKMVSTILLIALSLSPIALPKAANAGIILVLPSTDDESQRPDGSYYEGCDGCSAGGSFLIALGGAGTIGTIVSTINKSSSLLLGAISVPLLILDANASLDQDTLTKNLSDKYTFLNQREIFQEIATTMKNNIANVHMLEVHQAVSTWLTKDQTKTIVDKYAPSMIDNEDVEQMAVDLGPVGDESSNTNGYEIVNIQVPDHLKH